MLFHSVAIGCVSTFIIIIIYAFLYILERKKYIGIWILSWICHLLKHVIMFFIVIGGESYLLVASNQMLALLSALFLLLGCASYLKVNLNMKWKYCFVLIGTWIIVSNYLRLPFVVTTLPTFMLLSIASIRNGLLFIHLEQYKGPLKNIVGFSFIILGIHRADYPFLWEVEWFAPYGYSLGVIFKFVIGVSILALYLHKGRIDLIKVQNQLSDNIELQKGTILKLSQSQETLKKSEEKFKALFNYMNDAAYFFEILEDGTPGCFIEVNEAASRNLGYSREELLSMTIFDIIKGECKELARCVHKILQGDFSVETFHTSKSGQQIPVEVRSNSFVLDGKKVILTIARDITERKRAEIEFLEAKERLELAFDGANDGLWDWNIKSDNIYYSPMCKEILGYDDNQMPGSFEVWLDMVHPEDLVGVKNSFSQYFQKRLSYFQYEFRIMTRSGEYKWLLVRGKALRDNEENPVRMAGSITDISDRKDTECELIRNMEEAKRFQQKLLPINVPHTINIGIETSYKPAHKVGGDIYDIIQKGRNLILYIADVSGNGVPAAMMSTYLKASLKHFILDNENIDSAEVLNYIKDLVAGECLFEGRFITLLVCCIDLDTLKMRYSNGGHCYPLIRRKNEHLFLKSSERLISEYYKNNKYNIFEYQLEPLDRLLLYTDGIYEWKDGNRFFGLNNFKDYFKLNGLSKKTLDELVENSSHEDYNHDDISYILLEFYKVFEKTLPSVRDK